MNSLDPWRLIVTDPYDGSVVVPRARYGHPFYKEVPSWIHYGDDPRTHLGLFDGVFVGSDYDMTGADMTNSIGAQLTALSVPGYPFYGYGYSPFRIYAGADATDKAAPPAEPRKGLLAEVAPHVAPATGPITVKKELDDRQVLHVEICVDGKCYRTSMDLAPIITVLMQKLAQWHQAQHAEMPPPSTVVSTVQKAVDAAGDEMANVMVGHHVAVMTSGLFDDIGGALKSVGGAVGGTLRTLAPVIQTVATGVATAYGGPAAGAAAAQLVPMVTNLQANLLDPKGDPAKKAQAAQKLQQLRQVAASDPAAAQALAAANKAVKNTTVAYHVKQAVDKAAAGDRTAQQDVSTVVEKAQQGDPAAKSAYEVIAQALVDKAQHSDWGAKLWEQITGRGPGTVSSGQWYDIVGGTYGQPAVGAFWDDVKNAVLTVTGTKMTNQFIKDNHLEPYVQMAAKAVGTYYGGPAGGMAAGALAPTVMSLGVEDKKQAASAQRNVQGVKAVARRHGPEMAQAAEAGHAAVEHTATAYQVAQMVKDAKAGNPQAQQALVRLRDAAARGDQGAAKAIQAASAIDREQQSAPGAVVGWNQIAGVVIGATMTNAAPYYSSFAA